MLNLHQVIGRAGRDCELRFLPNGNPVANFSLAFNKRVKDKGTGQDREITEWFKCTAFDRLAEICADTIKKGRMVYVAGESRTRKHVSPGKPDRDCTEIVVDVMRLLPSVADFDPERVPSGGAQPSSAAPRGPRSSSNPMGSVPA